MTASYYALIANLCARVGVIGFQIGLRDRLGGTGAPIYCHAAHMDHAIEPEKETLGTDHFNHAGPCRHFGVGVAVTSGRKASPNYLQKLRKSLPLRKKPKIDC